MYTETILEYVDDAILKSEIDVMIAVTESYRKALTIITNEDYSESIIQESFSIYMEDGESQEGFSFKALFKKIINFFKNVCAKLKGIISNCFGRSQKYSIQTYNTFLIANNLSKIVNSDVFKEYLADEIDEDMFMEGLFEKKSSQEQEEEEYMKDQVKREKELEQNVQENDKALHDFVKTLRSKVYVDDKLSRLLNNQEAEAIVKVTCLGATKEELAKLRNAVNQIVNGENYEHLDKHIYDTLEMLVHTGQAFGKAKNDKRNTVKPSIMPQGAVDKAEQNISRNNTTKVGYDVDLLEKFADTFGKELNALAGRDYFSEENLKALMYGPQKIVNFTGMAIAFTGSTIFNLLSRAAYALATFNPKLIYQDIQDFGKDVDAMDMEFNQFADDDTVLRKEYGVKLNKTMSVLRFGVLDNVKEETYRWEDCPFNTLSYGKGNMMSMIAGGPITLTVLLVSTIFFHRPIEQFLPGPGTLAMMGLARTLNPGRSGKYTDMLIASKKVGV